MIKPLLIGVIALTVLAMASRSPASQAAHTPKVTWNVEPVGMVEPHPPAEIFYNPFPRGTGRRQWANHIQTP